MLVLIVGENKKFRQERFSEMWESVPEGSELITLDDTLTTLEELEQYLFPSLFTAEAPVVYVRFVLDRSPVTTESVKKFLASPTIFIFEELALPATQIALFKKEKAIVHVAEKTKSAKKEDIFSVTKCLTALDKKSRWLAYRESLIDHPIEAMIGILYWKLRTLAVRDRKYRQMYEAMIDAHQRAWRTGTPLDLLIEKVILSQ